MSIPQTYNISRPTFIVIYWPLLPRYTQMPESKVESCKKLYIDNKIVLAATLRLLGLSVILLRLRPAPVAAKVEMHVTTKRC